jgi:hypothetical protein
MMLLDRRSVRTEGGVHGRRSSGRGGAGVVRGKGLSVAKGLHQEIDEATELRRELLTCKPNDMHGLRGRDIVRQRCSLQPLCRKSS